MNENCPQLYGFYRHRQGDGEVFAWCYKMDNLYFYFAKSMEMEDTLHFSQCTVEDFMQGGWVGIRPSQDEKALQYLAEGIFDVLYKDIEKFRCIDYIGTGSDIIALMNAVGKMKFIHKWFYELIFPF